MASIITTSSDIPWELQGWYDRSMLENMAPALIFDKFGQVRPLPKNKGKRINFRRYGRLPVNTTPLTEGRPGSGKKLSTTDIYATIKFYGDYVTLTDELMMVGLDKNILDIAENVLSDQAKETKDTLTRDVLVTGTSVRYAGGVAARSSIVLDLRDSDMEVVKNELLRSDAKKIRSMNTAGNGVGTTPLNSTFIAITHPDTEKSVRALDGFIPVQEYPKRDSLTEEMGEVIEIGAAHDTRFLMTTNAKIWEDSGGAASTNNMRYTTADTALNTYATLVFAKNAYGIVPLQKDTIKVIVKALGSGGATGDPLDQVSTVGYKMAHTAKILNEDLIWRIEHACKALA